MDDLELVKMRLSRIAQKDLYALAQACGVPYGTLWHLKMRRTKNPRYKTAKLLAEHFKKQAA